MRALIQYVSHASIVIKLRSVAAIGPGYLIFIGISPHDGPHTLKTLVDRVLNLRLIPDPNGRLNHSLAQHPDFSLLLVPQFTLMGQTGKGRRPDYGRAAPPSQAKPLFDQLVALFARSTPHPVKAGVFGASMTINLTNQGPITFILDVS